MTEDEREDFREKASARLAGCILGTYDSWEDEQSVSEECDSLICDCIAHGGREPLEILSELLERQMQTAKGMKPSPAALRGFMRALSKCNGMLIRMGAKMGNDES